MASVSQVVNQYWAELRDGDEFTVQETLRTYARVLRAAWAEIEQLERLPSSASRDFKLGRLRQIETVLQTTIQAGHLDLALGVANAALFMEDLGRAYARDVVRVGLPGQIADLSFGAEAGQKLVGRTVTVGARTAGLRALIPLQAVIARDSPLAKLYTDLSNDAITRFRDALYVGVGLGLHPREVYGRIADALGAPLTRAMTIARTEMLRAYREGTRHAWVGMGVRRWEWHSARDRTTCAICWAMDGQDFSIADKMASHPNCRCTMLPILPDIADIAEAARLGRIEGLAALDLSRAARQAGWEQEARSHRLRPRFGSAEDELRRLPERDQIAILGPTRHAAWKSGRITLRRLATVVETEWGLVPTLRTLSALGLARAGAAERTTKLSPLAERMLAQGPRPLENVPDVDWASAYRELWHRDGLQNLDARDRAGRAKQDIMVNLATGLYRQEKFLVALSEWNATYRLHGLQETLIPTNRRYARGDYSLDVRWQDLSPSGRLALLKSEVGRYIVEDFVASFIQLWAQTSADHSTLSLYVQQRAKALFSPAAQTSHFADLDTMMPPAARQVIDTLLKEMYDQTQARLLEFEQKARRTLGEWQLSKSPGFPEYVPLYRGVQLDPDNLPPEFEGVGEGGGLVEMAHQPLSSWSTSARVAYNFSGERSGSYVFAALIPREWIVGTSRSGFGCLGEEEFVVACPKPFKVWVYRTG